MKIVSLEALIIRIPQSCGGADRLDTLLARVTTDSGLTGWGESQALAAPEVAGAIIHAILKPALKGKEFGGTGLEIETLWDAMYNQMRVSGQTGGFMLDAIAAVDIALWDLAGKIHRAPIAALISGRAAKPRLACYVNYLAGDTRTERLEGARTCRAAGCRRFKIFHNASQRELFEFYDALAAICRRQRLWFHGDGAFGALAILAPDLAPRLKGIECADSLAFDFHKWGQVPYDAGFILVRDGALHRQTRGLVDIDTVDHKGIHGGHGPGDRPLANQRG